MSCQCIFQGFGKPNVYHATVVIFLEFFAWGLLTSPMLTVSCYTKQKHIPKNLIRNKTTVSFHVYFVEIWLEL